MTPKLQVTKDYRLFERCSDNRPLNESKHKRLRKSMEEYGFLPAWPIACVRNGDKHLVVRDGQHRLAFAETLGLPVYFVVVDAAFDISKINNTQVIWSVRNHAEMYAAQGKKVYQEGLEFADRHGIPIGTAFCLLAGTTSFGNLYHAFKDGTIRIKDRDWAELVGAIYSHLVAAAPRVRNARLIEACMAVARVPDFDVQRLLSGIDRCREKLVPYSTKDAYLEMLEEVYNFGRKHLVGLKIAAIQAMRDRNAAVSSKAKAEKKSDKTK